MTYQYSLYGLNIVSDISFPDLAEADFNNSDITIEQGNIESLEDDTHLLSDETGIHIETAEIRLKISKGKRIEYQNTGGLTKPTLRSYVLASGIGAILHQRKFVVLHGSAVEVEGEAVLFCGDSGMGKSNTAAGFLKTGHALLSDDMCPIYFSDNKPMLLTSFMNLKLTEKDIERIGLENHKAVDWGDVKEKHRLIANYDKQQSALPVKAIYMLEPTSDGNASIEDIQGSMRIFYLVKNTFRQMFISKSEKAASDLKTFGQLSDNLSIKKVKRPMAVDSRKAINKLIKADLIAG